MNEIFIPTKKETPRDMSKPNDSQATSKNLLEYNQPEALKRWVDQNMNDEPTYQIRRHGRSSSSKVDSFSFQAQQSEVIDEENVLELLANQVDNKTIVQYYKNTLKKDQLNGFKRQNNRTLSLGASRLPKSTKLPIVQAQAAALLFEKFAHVYREYFRIFTIKCGFANPIRNKRDRQTSMKSNMSEVRNILHNIKQLNLTESESSPNLGPTNLSTPNGPGFLPSFPVSAVDSPHTMVEGIREGLANPELRYQNDSKPALASKYSKKVNAREENAVEGENSPKSSSSIKVESQENIISLADHVEMSSQQLQEGSISKKIRSQEGIQSSPKKAVGRNIVSTGDINNQRSQTALKKRDTTPMHTRLDLINKTGKSDFSLDSQIESKQKQEVVDLNGLKGYFISQGCTEKSISHHRMDSSSSIISNEALFRSRSTLQGSPLRGLSPQASRKESKYQEFTLQNVAWEKQKVLTQFVDVLDQGVKMRKAFEKLKIWAGNSPASILSRNGSGYKTGAFPTFGDIPRPVNYGFALELDQIPEADSREGTNYHRDVSSHGQATISAREYGYEMRRMQQKMKSILNLEIVCSQLMRKVYRTGFENIRRGGLDEKESSGSFRRNPNERELMNSGYDEINQTQPDSARKVTERGRHLSRTIKVVEDQNSSMGTKYRDNEETVREIDVASLEERLERSLEKKLESRITQNLDEKLRAKLQKELIRLLSFDYDDQEKRKDMSQDPSLQADTLNSYERLQRFESEKRSNTQYKVKEPVERLGSEQDYFDSKSFSPILDKRTPFFYNGVPGLSAPFDEKGLTISNDIKEFSASLLHQEDSPYVADSNSKTRINPVISSDRGNAFEEPTRQNVQSQSKYPVRQAQSVERQNYQSQSRYFIKTPYALGPLKTESLSLNRTEENIVLNRLLSDKDSAQASEIPSINYPTIQPKRESDKGMQKHKSVSSFQELGPKLPIFANKLDYSMHPAPKSVFLGELLEKLAYERVRQAFYKIQRPYLLQSLKSYKKKRTLNYLLFAKKVEKIYILRIRSAFTKLCLKNASRSDKKPTQKLAKRFELRMMKDFFITLKSHSKRQLNLQNAFGKVSSLFHMKKLRVLSEAFYYIASSSLLRKEYLLNLTLMCLQFSEMRKSKMRGVFNILKRSSRTEEVPQEFAKKMLLKKVLQETKLRWYFKLKQAFSKWKGTATNLSNSLMYEFKSFEHARAIKKHLPNTLKSIFASKDRINKCFAFYKLKNHTKNLKGAVALYGALNHQIISRLRNGYDNISNSETSENEMKVKLQNICDLFKSKLQKAFMRILIHSQTHRQSNVNINHKKGLLRLCVLTEDVKQNLLLHTLKMLELYNIHKKNQKSLYINLALKLFLLFDQKETSLKKEFLDALYFKTEKGALQQKAFSKLLRRSQTKNLAFFFNKFKSEIVNLKLNHSIVNLAIKNIIIAIEKLGKLQRTRKTQAFRKLNALLWDKQLGKENPTISLSEEKQSSYRESLFKLKDYSLIESMDIGLPKLIEEEPYKIIKEDPHKKLLKVLVWFDKELTDRNRKGFNAIYDVCKRRKLTERLQILGGRLFKKIIYKRCFLSFAQVKYYVDKKQQRAQTIKLNALLPLLKGLDKSASKDKKHFFRKWKAIVEIERLSIKNKISDFSRLRTKRIFDKWKSISNNSSRSKAQIVSGAEKLKEISLKKLMKFCKLAFKRIKNSKPQPAKLGSLTDRAQTEQAPVTIYKKSTSKLTKGKSQVISHVPKKSSMTLEKKSSMTLEKKSSAKPVPPIAFDSNTTQSSKKGQTKPQTDYTSVESPRSRFSRGSNLSLVKDSGVNSSSISQASSQASNKMSTPSSHFKSTKK